MRSGIVFGMMLLAMPVLAQPSSTGRTGGPDSADALERQQQLQTMERALEEAVARGVRLVERQLPEVPGVVFFAGPVRVRGFDLEDYGFFFDVEYPVVRRSMLWSMNMLQLSGGMSRVFDDLRRRVQAMPEGPGQLAFRQAITEMEAELQSGPPQTTPFGVGPGGSADPLGSDSPAGIDPVESYVTALRGELTSAMISYGGMLTLSGDQWLSVAARDGRGWLDPSIPGSSRTLKLRIRGSDLVALREGRLSVEELRQRLVTP